MRNHSTKSCCVTSILDTKVLDPAMERNNKTMSSVITATNLLAIRILSPDDGEQIGFIFYSPDKLGNIVLTAKGNDISPYLGVGFGNNVPKYRVGLGVDLGLFYQGESKFDVEGNGSFKPSGTSENEAVLEDAFRQFVVYPFVNFSLRFRLIK